MTEETLYKQNKKTRDELTRDKQVNSDASAT